jgi:hypothetical protein
MKYATRECDSSLQAMSASDPHDGPEAAAAKPPEAPAATRASAAGAGVAGVRAADSGAGRAGAAWEHRLRANPAFELVLHDRLPARQRRVLAALASDPEHYGVLRPRRGTGLGLKSIDRETALLFLTLARPGPLPGYVRSRLGDAGAAQALARLVADGVLEIEREPGSFVSGAAATAMLGAGAGAAPAGGRLAELSCAALRYGQELARLLPEGEALRLSLRLYGYHRLPLAPRWRRQLPDGEAVRRFLGIVRGGPARALLARHWREPAVAAGEPWLRWQPARAAAPPPQGAEGAATWKLYVSPAPEELPQCFGRLLDGLAAAGAPSFKAGATAGGLLRPDKIVAYFASFEELAAAAAAVGERLAGTAPHGVPFSSEIAGGGLLSWGVDPPAAGRGGRGAPDGRVSWRLWLTHRLARALIAGTAPVGGRKGSRRQEPSGQALGRQLPGRQVPGGQGRQAPGGQGRLAPGGQELGGQDPAGFALRPQARGRQAPDVEPLEPWRFAIERLRLEGIDTDSWTPGGSLWQAGAGGWS